MWKQHLVQLFCAAFQACCTGVHYSCDPELSSFYAHIYGHCDHSFITVVMSPSWVLFRVVVLTRLEHICTSFHIISRKHSHKYQYLTVAHVMSCLAKFHRVFWSVQPYYYFYFGFHVLLAELHSFTLLMLHCLL